MGSRKLVSYAINVLKLYHENCNLQLRICRDMVTLVNMIAAAAATATVYSFCLTDIFLWHYLLGLVQQCGVECRPADVVAVQSCHRPARLLQTSSLPFHHSDDPAIVEPGAELPRDVGPTSCVAASDVPRSKSECMQRLADMRRRVRQRGEVARSCWRRAGTLLWKLWGTLQLLHTYFK